MPRLNAKDAARREAVGHGSYYVEALARGLKVIRSFGRDRSSGMTLSDMARAADLSKPTVRRVLLTLADLGYAETDGRNFQLTPAVLSLAVAYLRSDLVAAVLQPACERVTRAAKESCFAAVLDDREIVMIAHSVRRQPLGLIPLVGMRMSATDTAAGRIILGQLPDEELDKRLAKMRLRGSTKFSLTDRTKLKAAIVKGRSDGFCITQQEATIGYCAIAVPLRRADGIAIGALSVPAHAERCATDPGLHGERE